MGKIDDASHVVRDNLRIYDRIKPKNQDVCYTVIATLNDVKTKQLIALATGTQACLRVRADDIEDCHAESLLKRAYKRYLIDAALRTISRDGPKAGENFLEKYGQQDLMLFVSQFPCGLITRFEGEEPVDEATGAVIKRKPGRGVTKDGKVIYVQRDNCLNKLKRWTSSYGFQGRSLYKRLGVRSRLTQIVIGDCEPDEINPNYEEHIISLRQQLSTSNWPIDCDLISMRREEFVFDSGSKRPQPVASIWWRAPSDDEQNQNIEYVVDGRRMGLTRRQCESDRSEWRLRSGDHWLKSDLDKVVHAFPSPR